MKNNRTRVLAQVLSVDAWHKPFRLDSNTAAVHVELSFHEGRIGGDDPSFPFTFRIRLKKALLSIRLDAPLTIVRDSVARPLQRYDAEHTRVVSIKDATKTNGNLKASLNPPSVGLSAETGGSNEVSKEEYVKLVQEIPPISVAPRPSGRHEYRWEMEPKHKAYLDGQPWNPISEPRLSVRLPSDKMKIDPAIKVFVSCALEDIEIDELVPKDTGFIDAMKNGIFNKINEAAAIQQLKITLKEAELEVSSLDDRFSHLIIADVLAVEE
jgi:hypothetical protein